MKHPISPEENRKIKAPNYTKGCGCEIHLRNKPDEYCLGHQGDCPCSKKKEENEKKD